MNDLPYEIHVRLRMEFTRNKRKLSSYMINAVDRDGSHLQFIRNVSELHDVESEELNVSRKMRR